MAQKFVFEELDEATRNYLTAVRNADGAGTPGVFASTGSTMAGCGCLAGPLIIGLTLALTLTTWAGVIYNDPVRVALLQTGGLVLGGWLLIAGMRAARTKGGRKIAGNWVYVDPLFMYEACREQVSVTRVDDAVEASFTHNYNNNAYQNSVVRITLADKSAATVTLKDDKRAEQMVVYLNYLAWARGEGGDRASLPPASLGGLAKYVSKHDSEPKDADGDINLNLVELDVTEVPEEPTSDRRALPALFPYVLIVLSGIAIFYVMAYFVNPTLRDDAIYAAVIHEPCEPWPLRLYLMDTRNMRHRDEVLARLNREYDETIRSVDANPPGQLRDGMSKILGSLKSPDFPTVSLKVSETGGPPGAEARVNRLRDGLVGKIEEHRADPGAKEPDYYTAVDGILGRLSIIKPVVPVPTPPGTNPKPRTPVGFQLIEFAQMPEDAPHAHFEVTYSVVPSKANPNLGELSVKAEIRTKVDADPVAVYTEEGGRIFPIDKLDQEIDLLRDRLLSGMLGPAKKGP